MHYIVISTTNFIDRHYYDVVHDCGFCSQIYDYEQFYLDLRVANTKKTAEWVKEYDLMSYYKLRSGNGVTSNELHNLAESLTTRSNESPLFEQ